LSKPSQADDLHTKTHDFRGFRLYEIEIKYQPANLQTPLVSVPFVQPHTAIDERRLKLNRTLQF